jgi:hypothetical protein
VDRHRFEELHAEGRRLINNWAQRASAQIKCADRDSFEPFIFGWIAVNGWASCVTGEVTDRKCLDVLMLDDDLNRRFDEHLATNTDLRESVQQFQSLWPIFQSQDIGYGPNPSGTRQEIVDKYRTIAPLARYSPRCSFRHREDGREAPMDWPHTLSAIYQVRCNLFHGFKGVHSENDVVIVSKAFRVLVRVLPMLEL